MLRSLRPVGLDNFLSWKDKFEALGYGPIAAARAAGSRPLKSAYQQARVEHLPPSIRRGLGCVIDIGGNEGQWSSALLEVASPRRLEIFEPNPTAHATLAKRMAGRPAVRVHQLALGSEPGELTLNVTATSTFASLLSPLQSVGKYYGAHNMAVAERVAVRVETLDAVARELPDIDLIKLDVQGFERQVIAGSSETLARTRALLVEANFVPHYETEDTFSTITELLKLNGFELWDLSPPFRADSGRALWCDAVYVQRGLIDRA